MLGFIFDTVMLKDENEDYYTINLNYNLWKDRYLPIFGKMIVSTRMKNSNLKEIKTKKGYVISNGENVTIKPITSYNKITDVFFKKKEINKQLKETIEQCDKVIIRLPSPLGNMACDICRQMNKDYAIEMVACPWDGYNHHGHWAGRIVAPYMYFMTKKQCKLAKRIVYVTKEFLQRRYPTNGITTNASNVMINEAPLEVLDKRLAKIEKVEDNYILGLVGPLNLESKGHKVALKALANIIKKYPNIKIEFLGAGEKDNLQKIAKNLNIEKNVVFKGTLPSGQPVLEWMDSLDILLIPSFQEGLPRVLIEAMSRACPAAGARTGGIPELIRKDVIHNPGNSRKLEKDIIHIIEDKEFAKQLAKENFENSKQYAKEYLDERRNTFWKEFANE